MRYQSPHMRLADPLHEWENNESLRNMLTYIITHLDNLDNIHADLYEMAGSNTKHVRHTGMRVAMLTTLKLIFDRQWSRELHDAWLSAYNRIVTLLHEMTEAKREHALLFA